MYFTKTEYEVMDSTSSLWVHTRAFVMMVLTFMFRKGQESSRLTDPLSASDERLCSFELIVYRSS
jgi:hypothetical protein